MFITKKHLDRRTFLRGAMGTAIALPFLDAMVPAATAQTRTAAAERLRFGAIYMPNGIYPGLWHPEKPGKGWAFNRTMRPLEPYREHLTTISQMKAPEGKKDMGGIHMGASAAFLNGSGPQGHNGEFNLIRSKKSVDQYIADAIGGDTPIHSLEVGTEDMGTSAGACDGYPCVFFNTMAWRDEKSPLPVSVNPQVTFERMFGEPGSAAERLARLQTKESMLDSVLQETARLEKKIGASDNAILDEYLTSVRRVEEQLKKMQSRSEAIAIPEDFDEHMTVTYDLLHLAFQGDLTRVFSFMVGHEASGRSYAFLGVKEPHHSTSHHKNTPESLEAYAKIGAYHMVRNVSCRYVTHFSVGMLPALCNRIIWLDNGAIRMDGAPEPVARAYDAFMRAEEENRLHPGMEECFPHRRGEPALRIRFREVFYAQDTGDE